MEILDSYWFKREKETSSTFSLGMSAVSHNILQGPSCTSQFLPSLLAIFEFDTTALSLWSFPEWFYCLFALCEVPVLFSPCSDSKKQHTYFLKYWKLKPVTESSFYIKEDEFECQQRRKDSRRGSVYSPSLVLQTLSSSFFSRCPDWEVLGFRDEQTQSWAYGTYGPVREVTCRRENETQRCRCIGDTEMGMLRASWGWQ